MHLAQAAGHPILVCIKPDPGAAELLHESVALAVSLSRPLHVLSLVPHARGAAGLRAIHEELSHLAEKARKAIPGTEVIISVEVIVDSVDRRIQAYAQEHGVRLIIVGRRRLPTKQHIHDHGTTTALLSLLDVPLLIVPMGKPKPKPMG